MCSTLINCYTQHLCDVQIYILLIHFTCIHDGNGWTIPITTHPPFFFFFWKILKAKKNMTQCCVRKVMCVTLSTLYISYARMHMANLQYLLQENIYANVKLHFYNRENVSYELFNKKLFILSYYRWKSQHLCSMFMSMGGSIFIFICSHFQQLALYKSSLTGAFFMHVEDTYICTVTGFVVLNFWCCFHRAWHIWFQMIPCAHNIVHYLMLGFCRIGNLDTPLWLQDTTFCLVEWWT